MRPAARSAPSSPRPARHIAAAIAPQLPDHVQAVALHPEAGQLDLRPDSPAFATWLRLISARIVAAANEAVRTYAVRTVRVLAVGAAPASRVPAQTPVAGPKVPQTPMKTRAMASPRTRPSLPRAVSIRRSQRRCSGRPGQCGS
ncbi:DciA family protein [Streptomyces spectabilis]|uniref:DciA family protein n=1 Tax=Streptomyces spectabilis TaxID=68270 RepID=UPI001CEF6743|nr:DciA family protein [Streptomyces spectabilis]